MTNAHMSRMTNDEIPPSNVKSYTAQVKMLFSLHYTVHTATLRATVVARD